MAKKSKRKRADKHVATILKECAAEQTAEFGLRTQSLLDRNRRARVGSRARAALLSAVSKKAGFDLAQLYKLHDTDYETCKQHSALHRKKVQMFVKGRISQQRSLLKHVLRNRDRFEYHGTNPITKISEWGAITAPTATRQDLVRNGSVIFNPQPSGANTPFGTNRVTFSTNCSVNGDLDYAMTEVRATYVFQTDVPSGGILSVAASFSPIGSYELTAKGGCLAHGSALVKIFARLRVRVRSQIGRTFFAPTPAFEEFFLDHTSAGCDSDSKSGAFNFDNDLHTINRNRVINVASGDRVFATAQYLVDVRAMSGAVADLDLSSAGHGLFVPVVCFTIED